MGQYNGAVITAAGQGVIAQAIGGDTLEITKIVSSATAIPAGTDLTTLVSISDIEQTVTPGNVQVFNGNILQIPARFTNTGVNTAYLIQTFGVFGQVTGGSETLLAVSTAVTPDQMPAESAVAPSAFIYNIQLTVQSADQITVTVDDAGTATVEDLNTLYTTIDAQKLDIDGNGKSVKVSFQNMAMNTITSFADFLDSFKSGANLHVYFSLLRTVFLNYVAQKNHSANTLDYGGGDTTNFGHVKLSDVYNSQIGTAAQSIGASQKAVHDAYDALNSNIRKVLSPIAEVRGNYKLTTTNWEYTGVSFTPSSKFHFLYATCISGVDGLALSTTTDLAGTFTKLESAAGVSGSKVWRTPVGTVVSATVYLFAKNSTAQSSAVEYRIDGYVINNM